jgi:hypothetical protein
MNKQEMRLKETDKIDSKPAQLAKIMYEGIVRMIKTKNTRIGEKKLVFDLDFDRKRRKNIIKD